jgi:hypothetical protein
MKIKPINENIFGTAKRFTDLFFDSLKNNATHRMLKQVEKAGASPELIRVMNKLQRDKEELDAILANIEKYKAKYNVQ